MAMTFAELAAKIKQPKRKIYRWADHGVPVRGVPGGRVYLDSFRIGILRFTTGKAWRAFKEACNPERKVRMPSPSKSAGQAAKARFYKLAGTKPTAKHHSA